MPAITHTHCERALVDTQPHELTPGGVLCAAAAALSVLVALGASLDRDDVADALLGDGVTSGLGALGSGGGPSPGDAAAAALWAAALWFASPLQLLLLFLGRIDTERPSDWALRRLGALTGQR